MIQIKKLFLSFWPFVVLPFVALLTLCRLTLCRLTLCRWIQVEYKIDFLLFEKSFWIRLCFNFGFDQRFIEYYCLEWCVSVCSSVRKPRRSHRNFSLWFPRYVCFFYFCSSHSAEIRFNFYIDNLLKVQRES